MDKVSNSIVLDLGCGNKKRPGSIGVDYNSRLDGDVNHDLNIFPYPFEPNSVDKIYIDNCLEHLNEPLHVMEELHRILKVGGEVKVIVPYFRSPSAFHDPTHKTFYTVESFSYYDPKHPINKRYDYTNAHFRVEKTVFHEHLESGLIKRFIVFLANKWPNKYENYISSFLPLHEISFYLRKI